MIYRVLAEVIIYKNNESILLVKHIYYTDWYEISSNFFRQHVFCCDLLQLLKINYKVSKSICLILYCFTDWFLHGSPKLY